MDRLDELVARYWELRAEMAVWRRREAMRAEDAGRLQVVRVRLPAGELSRVVCDAGVRVV